ncbi:unnamed protein product [Penicillium roqueforti FM164]|uniref:Genomic scaffold, ProqFM164S02 n=1 Tax=Penicillium roqueforti (strain FM164) TaxID=1365484 RepID=W6QBP7_PENRF|nr:unnamed protein product [Penicillium roqueforti FM164]
MLNARRWRLLFSQNRLYFWTISGVAIVVANEKLHLSIAIYKIVDRRGSDK